MMFMVDICDISLLQEEAHCATIYTYGNDSVAVIGNRSGKWLVLDLDSHKITGVHIDGNEQHECAEFSPGLYV